MCLSKDLFLRLSDAASGTVAAHQYIEGLEVLSEWNLVAVGTLLLGANGEGEARDKF